MTDVLDELGDLQQSDENVTLMRFTFETRTCDGPTDIRREYTFDYAREWDTWVFSKFEEFHSNEVVNGSKKWDRVKDLTWDDPNAATIDVPPEVTDKLQQATTANSVTIQSP